MTSHSDQKSNFNESQLAHSQLQDENHILATNHEKPRPRPSGIDERRWRALLQYNSDPLGPSIFVRQAPPPCPTISEYPFTSSLSHSYSMDGADNGHLGPGHEGQAFRAQPMAGEFYTVPSDGHYALAAFDPGQVSLQTQLDPTLAGNEVGDWGALLDVAEPVMPWNELPPDYGGFLLGVDNGQPSSHHLGSKLDDNLFIAPLAAAADQLEQLEVTDYQHATNDDLCGITAGTEIDDIMFALDMLAQPMEPSTY
jgi:hypothetical protein